MNTKIKGVEDKLGWQEEFEYFERFMSVGTYKLIINRINSILLQQRKDILELKCLKEEKHIENKTLQDALRYKACYSNLDIDARNSLRLEIKNKIDKL